MQESKTNPTEETKTDGVVVMIWTLLGVAAVCTGVLLWMLR